MAPTEPSDGRLIVGRYRIRRLLGRGGMGTVWAAHDEVLGREVALKEIRRAPELTPEQWDVVQQRTKREARAAARINDPSAVTVFDVVEDEGGPWIVMQLLPAQSLAEVLAAKGRLTPAVAAAIGLDLVDALAAAHRAGVLHRDVKPANVMIMDSGRAVLTDFGIATVDDDPTLTATGLMIGSPGYMAPERARGLRATAASDLWSLGATLFAAVEGESPFRRDGQLPTLHAVVNDPPAPAVHAGVLRPVIEELLVRDPALRPDATRTRELLARARDAKSTLIDVGPMFGGFTPRPPIPTMLPRPQQKDATVVATEPVAPVAAAEPAPTTPAAGAPVAAEAAVAAEAPAAEAPAAAAPVTAAPVTVKAPVAPEPPVAAQAPVTVPEPPEPPELPEPADPAEPPPAPGSRRRPIAVLVATVAVIALVALTAVLLRPDEPDRAGPAPAAASTATAAASPAGKPTGSAAAGTAAGGTASTVPTTPTGTTPATTTPATTTPAATSAGAAIPAGFRNRKDPTGFTVAVPDGWTRSVRGSSVFFRPPSGRGYLQIDTTKTPKADTLPDWQNQAASAPSRFPGYRKVRLERVDYRGWNAADWEFTWRASGGTLHVLNRNVRVSDRRAYALLWSVPAGEWTDRKDDFDVIARTFQPAR